MAKIISSRIIFLVMGDIDTKSEIFRAQAFVECCWEDDLLIPEIGKIKAGKFKFDPKVHWHPDSYIENAIGDLQQELVKYQVEVVEKGSTYSYPKSNLKALTDGYENTNLDVVSLTVRVYEQRKIKGVFYERLELYDFPIDLQELSIKITCKKPKDQVVFETSKIAQSGINIDTFQDSQQYELYEYVKPEAESVFDSFRKFERSEFKVSAYIVRKPGYYLNNAILLIFLITSLAFTPFAFPANVPHFRCQVTGLLLLTEVNFRWVITQRLPAVSYLTLLDKYAIGCILILITFCVWHAIVGSNVIYSTLSLNTALDKYLLYSFAGLFAIFNVIFMLWFFKLYLDRKSFKEEKKQESELRAKGE